MFFIFKAIQKFWNSIAVYNNIKWLVLAFTVPKSVGL